MAPIVSAIEVTRPPEVVFAFVTDPTRLREWQDGVVSARMEGGGPPAAGSRFTTTTRIGGAEQISTLEITELSPPRVWSVRGVDGPVRVKVTVTVEPLPGGQGSRVTVALDFDGHGPGRLLVPLVVRPQAARQAPHSCQRLKERLESQPR
ncbi:MAG: SRPBCC family protein [Gemmatimonadota bacterium]